MLPRNLAVVVVLAGSVGYGWAAQASAEDGASLAGPAGRQPLEIVDFPTAGLYPKGVYGVAVDLYSEGGLLADVGVGIAGFASFGISYGGIEFIGSGDPELNPRPEVNVRVRILEEDIALPAVAVGFDSQGHGRYFAEKDSVGEERYLIKSRGLYAVASKNWEIVGPMSLHGGINYSFENDIDNDPTVFVGLVKAIGDQIEVAVEYDIASNDNKVSADPGVSEESRRVVQSRGIVNASVAWLVNPSLSLSFKARDIAAMDRRDTDDERKWNRGFSLAYRAEF